MRIRSHLTHQKLMSQTIELLKHHCGPAPPDMTFPSNVHVVKSRAYTVSTTPKTRKVLKMTKKTNGSVSDHNKLVRKFMKDDYDKTAFVPTNHDVAGLLGNAPLVENELSNAQASTESCDALIKTIQQCGGRLLGDDDWVLASEFVDRLFSESGRLNSIDGFFPRIELFCEITGLDFAQAMSILCKVFGIDASVPRSIGDCGWKNAPDIRSVIGHKTYVFHGENGKPVYSVMETFYEGKATYLPVALQHTQARKHETIHLLPDGPLPVYNADLLARDVGRPVVITSNLNMAQRNQEICFRRNRGLVFSSWFGDAKMLRSHDLALLNGRNVYFIPDLSSDEDEKTASIRDALNVLPLLKDSGATVQVVVFKEDGMPDMIDADEFLRIFSGYAE